MNGVAGGGTLAGAWRAHRLTGAPFAPSAPAVVAARAVKVPGRPSAAASAGGRGARERLESLEAKRALLDAAIVRLRGELGDGAQATEADAGAALAPVVRVVPAGRPRARKAGKAARPRCRGTCKLGLCSCGRKR